MSAPDSETILVRASAEFLSRGAFDFNGKIIPVEQDDGTWELMFVEGEHSEWPETPSS